MHQARSRHPPRRRAKEREVEARAAPRSGAHERHGSPTLRAIVEASQASATASYRAVRQGLYTAQCSGRNALRRWSKFPAAPAVRIQAKAPPPTALFTMGVAIYGALLYVAGAAPALLPALYLLFAAVAGPWRAWDFVAREKSKNAFFLVDFCYVVNVAVVAFLMSGSTDFRAKAMLYSLADGPLAAALIAWQCSWVFSSPSHSISVLLHLLPGLALFVCRYVDAPLGAGAVVRHILSLLPSRAPPAGCGASLSLKVGAAAPGLVWTFVAPLLFYLTWQLCYFLVVQVLFRKYILAHGYQTSYIALARRAARTNNFWNRLVRKGSVMRRCATYGAVQAAFTVITLVAVVIISQSFYLGLVWQVVKFATPVYYGARKSIGSALR